MEREEVAFYMPRPKTCQKRPMTRNRSGMVIRLRCRLPHRHQGTHEFVGLDGKVVPRRAWIPL